MKKLLTIAIVLLTASCAKAQEWDSGEIKDVEIEIVKDRQIVLPKANRLFDKIAPRPIDPAKPEVDYSFKAFNFSTPELSPSLRPLRLKQEDPQPAYRGYVSAGYGNFSTPYLEAFVTSKQDKKKLIGAHALYNHSGKGPVDGKNSGSGTSGVSAFVQTFSKDISFRGNIGFQNRSTHFYGYPEGTDVSSDEIEQSYSIFDLGLSIANAKNSDFAYQLGGNFSHLSDKFDAAESAVDFNFKSSYKVSDDQSIVAAATYSILNRKDVGVEAKARNLFQAKGYYSFFPVEEFRLQVGAVVALENDTLDSKSFHFYPDVRATYAINDAVDFVGSLSGGMEKVSLQSLANENIWLAPAVALSHTNKVIDLQAGLRAKLGSKVLAGAGISIARLKNMYFFINDPADVSKFQVLYDNGTVERINLYASLLYTHANIVRVSLQGDYFGYNTDEQAEAWHKPGYRVTFGSSYNLFKKLIFNLDMIAQGNMKAFDYNTSETVKLDPAFDLNVRTEYLFSDKFSAFVELNNILANEYPVYMNYPVRGFQALAGFTWKF
ncbi:MAG TPA: hypothetical protein VFU05_08765 [Cyclobacteriaceae bacterium]|nr:hypothetical protein [Cyclobacteriaceae bacterium]